MGPSLVIFFGLLMVMSWGLGLVIISMVLRFGLGAESLAWAAVFAFLPISAVYYPVEVLPWWLQPVALATPAAHVFEGMRELLINGQFSWEHFFWAAGLASLYLLIGIITFRAAFQAARADGKLLQMGE
jgi:ABC-2 type transport system permease protein